MKIVCRDCGFGIIVNDDKHLKLCPQCGSDNISNNGDILNRSTEPFKKRSISKLSRSFGIFGIGGFVLVIIGICLVILGSRAIVHPLGDIGLITQLGITLAIIGGLFLSLGISFAIRNTICMDCLDSAP